MNRTLALTYRSSYQHKHGGIITHVENYFIEESVFPTRLLLLLYTVL